MASTSSAASLASTGFVDRRQIPRMATPSVVSAAPPRAGAAMSPARTLTLDDLRARPRKPGEASFFYFDHHFQFNSVKVLPGEYFVASDNVMVTTVLGSCIAACLWDSRVHVGGMNHFMLPEGEAGDTSGRFGSYAMELLINDLLKLGARRESLQAKIFGGGQVMHGFTTMNVGERNTQFVTEYLRTERIPIVSEDVLDIYPRRVCYFPVTGKAMVKRLAHAHPDALDAQERKGSATAVAQNTAGGSVDLF